MSYHLDANILACRDALYRHHTDVERLTDLSLVGWAMRAGVLGVDL